MSVDWLEDLERQIDNGKELFACQGLQQNEWVMDSDPENLKKTAKRTANSKKFQIHIYRLVNRMDTTSEDQFLCVRKILDPSPKGEPRFQWSIVDTREAAEMMRDVSQGPTPYFGAVIVDTVEPD